MQKVSSLAFNFDSVQDFTIIDSRFHRIAMRGIKVEKCHEFNVIGGSRFLSLASNAFELRCNKFMLAYNTFDRLEYFKISIFLMNDNTIGYISCNKILHNLYYRYLYRLFDASLNVKSALIDIQGNTFVSLTGKPFIRLETSSQKV